MFSTRAYADIAVTFKFKLSKATASTIALLLFGTSTVETLASGESLIVPPLKFVSFGKGKTIYVQGQKGHKIKRDPTNGCASAH